MAAALLLLFGVLGSMNNTASDSGAPAKAASTSSSFDAKAFAEALNESRPKTNAPMAASAAPSLAPIQTMGSSEVSAEVLSRKYATMRYLANGLEAPSASALKSISIRICEDLRNGDDGRRYYLAHDIPGPDSKAAAVAEAINYAYATTNTCHLTSGEFELGNTVRSRLLNYLDENSSAMVPARSFTLPPSEPRPFVPSTGGSVRCNDGSSSSAGGKQGACSWHGGVRN